MAAQAELDRYIKENEVSLYSINQSKLRRNPLSEGKQRHDHSFSVASVTHSKTSHANYNSTERELEQFIVRLKQMQQFRVSQLQKVNALFNYDMDMEDQMDLNLKTAEEVDQMCENEDFEAFLLGLTKEGTTEKESGKSEATVPPVVQSTLFTKRKPAETPDAPLPPNSADASAAVGDSTHTTLLAHVDDASVIQLQKSRLERTARLKNISATIHAMGMCVNRTSPAVARVSVTRQPTVAAKTAGFGPGVGQVGAGGATPGIGAGEARWRRLPDRTPLRDLPSRALPARSTGTPRIATQSSNDYTGSSSFSMEAKQYEPAPPPPPPMPAAVSVSVAVPTAAAAKPSMMQPAPPPAPQEHEAPADLEALTLQAIADDDLYLSSSTAVGPVQRSEQPDAYQQNQHRNPALLPEFTTPFSMNPDHVTQKVSSTVGSLVRTSKRAPKPFLVSNTRRREAERAVHSEGSADEGSQKAADLSLSSIAAHSYASGSGSGSEMSEVDNDAFSDHSAGAKGIGFGRRYGGSGSTCRPAAQPSAGSIRGKKLRWESAGEGRDDSSVESAPQKSNGRKFAGSTGSAGHEGIFDYMDALESPDPKRGVRARDSDGSSYARSTTREDSAVVSGVRESVPARGALLAEIDEQGSASKQLCDRAAQVAASARRYYQRRLHQLEHGSDPEDDLVQGEVKSDRPYGVSSAMSPERREYSRNSNAYDSPTPKTPTFNPLFS